MIASDRDEQIATTKFLVQFAETVDGLTWELIEGRLCSRPQTTRRPRQGIFLTRISCALAEWLDQQPQHGSVHAGEVRCRLVRNPDTIIGIDAAIWLGAEHTDLSANAAFMEGPPTMAVEVQSDGDTAGLLSERRELLLKHDVRQVWIADPDLQTVTIHRPGREPEFFTASQTLTAEPELPGFRVEVRQLFQAKKGSK